MPFLLTGSRADQPSAGRRARRGAALTVIGFAFLSAIGLFAASAAAAPKITATAHEGQKKVAGIPGDYTPGNITEYTELDYVNYQFTLDANAEATGTLEIRFSADDNVCTFFDGTLSLGTYDDSAEALQNVSGPTPAVELVGTPVIDGGEWVQTVDVSFSAAGQTVVNYYLRLSDEAGECKGSSQHSRLEPAGGAVVQTGAQNVPIPANQIIELPELIAEKNIDRDANGTFESDAAAGEYCFTLDASSICVPTDADGRVVFTNVTPDGAHTVTETQLVFTQGTYAFVSGSGTNCTFSASSSTATATVASGTTSSDATCIFNNAAPNLAPTVEVTKDATPATLPEPGGLFTFSVSVRNTSTTESVTITSLSDDVYGNIATRTGSTCGTLIGDVLAAGATSDTCTFTGTFTGNAGDPETDTVTVVVTDDDGQTATDTDTATVALSDVAATMTVEKTAAPLTLPEPGGTFTFTVSVTNTSAVDSLTITSLTDDIHGNLATRTGSTCGTLIGDVLAAGGTSDSCTFTADFTGNAGDDETDIVTATASDDDGHTITAHDDATVRLTDVVSTLTVTKTASPLSLPEPGGTFTFTVSVTNTSAVDSLTITSLTDNVHGNLATRTGSTCGTLIGDVLAPGVTSATCTFTADFTGNAGDAETDIVTAAATDNDGQTATNTDDAVIGISGVDPTVTVLKTASPSSLPEPGGTFTFTVVVNNTSAVDPVTITELGDSVYGDLLAARAGSDCDTLDGAVIAPLASATCTFTGDFTGNAGASENDVVTVVVIDDDETTATDDDDAVVTITDVAPTVTVVKTAAPSVLPAPGGNFAFTVVVTNTSTEAITIMSLTDDTYDLTAVDGNCDDLVGDTLAAGASATCTFTGNFTGNAGDSETDVITVIVIDDDDTTGMNTDDVTVNLGQPIVVEVAGETERPAPAVPAPAVPAPAVPAPALAPAPAPAVQVEPAAELPRTGSREVQRQVLLALGLVVAGGSFRLITRRRRFQSA